MEKTSGSDLINQGMVLENSKLKIQNSNPKEDKRIRWAGFAPLCDFEVKISQEARVGFMEGRGRCSGPSSRPVMERRSDSIASSTSSSGLKSAAW